MSERLTCFFASRWGIVLAEAIIGVLAPPLQKLGNLPNMGICVPCFERDIAGALGLHRAVVQHIRPEIIGFVLGALIAAHFFSEFKARAGSVDDAARFDRAPVRGAAFAHNFALAGRPDNFAEGLLGGMGHCGMAAVVLGLIVCVMIGFTMTIGPKV